MALNETQVRLLDRIQSNLRRGDINSIAKKTSLTREYVGKVLSLNNDDFNEDIVAAAVTIISVREDNAKRLLKKLPAETGNNINTSIPIMQETL